MKAVYDFEYWQPSYTIANFLMSAEQERLKRGEEGIDVTLMPGTRRYKYWPSEEWEIRQCMLGIVLPMINMLPSVQSIDQPAKRIEYDAFNLGHKFTTTSWSDPYMNGIRPLRLPLQVTRDPKLVTMTFRECGNRHWHQRDTNTDEWLRAARLLMDLGYKIVIVRDTSKSHKGIKGFLTDPAASTNLDDRAKLYLSAHVNLFVSNGPAWFALSLDVPAIVFRPTTDGANKAASTQSMKESGFEPGEQVRGAPPYQRLVWHNDTAANIVEEVMRFG